MKWIRFSGAQHHDRDRFEQIYEKYHGMVYNYVYRLLLNREDTEDLVSDIFLRAMQSFSRYERKKGEISTWLCGIAHNRVVDFFRSAAVRTNLSLEELWENGNFPEEARDDWTEATVEWEVREILRRLRVQERELLGWRYVWGLSNREIARRLNITEQAVVGRFHRVLAKCREIAKDMGVEGVRERIGNV